MWSLYGDLNFRELKYQEAFEAYKNSAELEDGKGRAYLMMAYCALEIGDKEEAVAQLELASNYPEQASKAREILSKTDVYLP